MLPLDTTQGVIRRNIGGRMRRELELAGGIITSKMNSSAIEESVEETESVSRPVGLGVRWAVGTLEADPDEAGRGVRS